ncbi:MAG: DUF1588 domain-containing protein [Planctomycetaceae bacterium]
MMFGRLRLLLYIYGTVFSALRRGIKSEHEVRMSAAGPVRKNHILKLYALGCVLATGQSDPPCACSAELTSRVRQILEDRCFDCHNRDEKNGGLNLQQLAGEFDPLQDLDAWVKIEAAIVAGHMPPAEEERLEPDQIKRVQDWFESQFVTPGGVQHAGRNYPRRMTREELQNTLEDILHVELRQTVTNSRLHVIPDTIIEKFFAAGVHGESGFSNCAVTLSRESVDLQNSARCFSLVLSLLDSSETARMRLFGTAVLPERLTPAAARSIIDRFGRSAFRREVTTAESEAFVKVFEQMAVRQSAFEAMKSSFLAVLLSPSFLYRFETPADGQTPVQGNELAVRLSYFLWSAPPDQTLLDLASAGELHNTNVLQAQVQRMLKDPRRIALAENLGGEWFGYKQLRQQSSVNKRSDRMAGFYRTQWEEALLFFDSLLRFNQSVFSIVDADWAYSNPHQSGIYRLQTGKKTFATERPLPAINVHYRSASRQIRQGNYEYRHAPLSLVGLMNADRGGLLTIGPTLSVTSTPNRTSPIRRGVWVMERILGKKFEVPEDVPDLEATQKKARSQRLKLSHTEILKLHSSQAGCAACHQYIDPIGFGLEVFDQLGIPRTLSEPNPAGEKLEWKPDLTPAAYADRVWPLTKPLVPGSETRVFFQYTRGRHRLDIRRVRLESDGVQLIDKHSGFSGEAQRDNVWLFALPQDAPATGWRLIAEIKGSGGTDSSGQITVSGPHDRPAGYQLPGGQRFSSPGELKRLLLTDYREQIVDNVIRRVLAYALGRRIRPVDRPAIRQIRQSLQAHEDRMNSLIEAVVLSYPFRHKEN